LYHSSHWPNINHSRITHFYWTTHYYQLYKFDSRADRQTDTWTDIQTDRQTGRQVDMEQNNQKNKQTDIKIYMQIESKQTDKYGTNAPFSLGKRAKKRK